MIFCVLTDEEGDSNGDETSANVRKDLSEWQERHAMLVLSKVKVSLLLLLLDEFIISRCFYTFFAAEFRGSSGFTFLYFCLKVNCSNTCILESAWIPLNHLKYQIGG